MKEKISFADPVRCGGAVLFVRRIPEMDMTNYTFTQLRARLDVAFGGRAAEEIMYGKPKWVANVHSVHY